uniref:Chromo domain-containing protein n=1 Tax=Globodera rostochiensis TaxID=31243 RepID=A0A914HAC9_GLORO
MIVIALIPLQLMAIAVASALVIITQCCGGGKKNTEEPPPPPQMSAVAEQPTTTAAGQSQNPPTSAVAEQPSPTASKNAPALGATTNYAAPGSTENIFSKMSAQSPTTSAAPGAVSKKSVAPTTSAAPGAVSKKSVAPTTSAAPDAVSKKSPLRLPPLQLILVASRRSRLLVLQRPEMRSVGPSTLYDNDQEGCVTVSRSYVRIYLSIKNNKIESGTFRAMPFGRRDGSKGADAMDFSSKNKIAKNVGESILDKGQGSSTSSDTSDGVPTEEDVFEVEKIVGHKTENGTDYWKVRWVGYEAADDTWEPRENFLDKKVLTMLTEFELERLSKKEKRKEMIRKSIEHSHQHKEETGNEEGEVDEQNASWFGIKRDEGPREQRRLFVPDRVLSKTEKLLTEIGSSPGVRILRRHLKEHSTDRFNSPKIDELTPEKVAHPKSKRKRSGHGHSSNDIFTSESSAQEVTDHIEKNDATTLPQETKVKVQKTSDDQGMKEKERLEPTLTAHKKSKHAEEDTHHSELGISKGLKPKKFAKHSQRKLASSKVEESVKLKKRNKDEKIGLKKSESLKDSTHKSKDKHLLSRSAAVVPSETGLMLPFASEGLNVATYVEHFTKAKQSSLGANDSTATISQEEFEELTMKNVDLNRADEFGKTLLHKLCEIKCGVSHTQCELIGLLVSSGGRLNILENGNNQTPLHIAIANRRLCHVRQLLDLQSPVNLSDRSGKSPLVLALDCSDFEFLKCLLRAGASFQPALEKLYDDKDRNKRQFRFLTDHEAQLRKALNAARDTVAMNLSVKCISPIFANPLHEAESVHSFHLNSQPQLPVGDYAYLLLACVAEFLQDDRDKESGYMVEARMWGQNPVQNVSMNDKNCQQMKPGNKFAFFCAPGQGENRIKLCAEPVVRKSKHILLTQVVLAQFFRPSRPSVDGHTAAATFNRK